MKINGKEIAKQGIEVIVFPRPDGDLVFKAKPVINFDDFIKLCPMPVAREVVRPGNIRSRDVADPDYKKSLEDWSSQRSNWMIINSLSATEGLTWDTVNLSDCKTWGNIVKELEDSGLSQIEMARLMDTIITACGLTQSKIDEATQRFLAGQAALQSE